MTMYLITRTAKFKRAYKLAVKRGLNMSKLNEVIGLPVMVERRGEGSRLRQV